MPNEWSQWSAWGDCDASTCGAVGTQTQTRECGLVVEELSFCAGSDKQSRNCNNDPIVCEDPFEEPCMGNMTRTNITSSCDYTCSALAGDFNCVERPNRDYPMTSCHCEEPEVFDEATQKCVGPNECICYLPECDQYINQQDGAQDTCCPDLTCNCVNGELDCTGSCPVPCVATEWADWSECDADCLRSRKRCIVQHADFGGSPCNGGEEEVEECDWNTTRCQKCYYNNGTDDLEYNQNDVVYSSQCYDYICLNNETRMELRCTDGPFGQDDCEEGQTYIAPQDDDEAYQNNCCGRCEAYRCHYVKNNVELQVDTCVPKTVDVGMCKGGCGMPQEAITQIPTTLAAFELGVVHLHSECSCCKGTVETIDIQLECDGEIKTVQFGHLAQCACEQCGDSDTDQVITAERAP